jgi:UDP:flavonoid glycosyltransferase YjiC (YdhE family)
MYGVPMISFPGGVQERRFNSEVLEKHRIGKMMENTDFTPQKILSAIEDFKEDPSYRENASKFGKTLVGLGGADSIIQTMEKIVKAP